MHKGEFVKKQGDFRKEFSWAQEVIQYIQGIEIEEKVVWFWGYITVQYILLKETGEF